MWWLATYFRIINYVCSYIATYIFVLFQLGKRWEFVWGEGSKDYSEEVIRSFICKHGSIVQRRRNQQLSLTNLAAIHAGGSSGNVDNRQFGKEVAALAIMGKFRQLVSYIVNFNC